MSGNIIGGRVVYTMADVRSRGANHLVVLELAAPDGSFAGVTFKGELSAEAMKATMEALQQLITAAMREEG